MAFTLFPGARRAIAGSGPPAADGPSVRGPAASGGRVHASAGGDGWLTSEGVQKSYGKRKVVKGVSVAVAARRSPSQADC